MVILSPQWFFYARISPLGESTRGLLRALFVREGLLCLIRVLGCVSLPSGSGSIVRDYRVFPVDVIRNHAFLFVLLRRWCGLGRFQRLSQSCELSRSCGRSWSCGLSRSYRFRSRLNRSILLPSLTMRIDFAQRRFISTHFPDGIGGIFEAVQERPHAATSLISWANTTCTRLSQTYDGFLDPSLLRSDIVY
jgi:hypothetical protein